MTKHRTSSGVALLARINLVVYVLLVLWALSSVLKVINLITLGLVLYAVAGVICSSGLRQHMKWSWYLALAMWTSEGAVISWITYSNIGLLFTDPKTITILLIPIFKFATAVYLAQRKVRETFNPKNS